MGPVDDEGFCWDTLGSARRRFPRPPFPKDTPRDADVRLASVTSKWTSPKTGAPQRIAMLSQDIAHPDAHCLTAMVAAPSKFYDRDDRIWGPFTLATAATHEEQQQTYVSYTEQMTRPFTDDSQRRLLKYEMTTRGCDPGTICDAICAIYWPIAWSG